MLPPPPPPEPVAQLICSGTYSIPAHVRLSPECTDLLARIFVVDPTQRITLAQIMQHPWVLSNLPPELQVSCELEMGGLGARGGMHACATWLAAVGFGLIVWHAWDTLGSAGGLLHWAGGASAHGSDVQHANMSAACDSWQVPRPAD